MFTGISILLTLLTGTVGLSVVYLASLIWKNYVAKRELLKKSPNLPHAPGGNLITGHTGLFLTQKHNTTTIHEYHKKLGKTYAFLNQQVASVMTTDIDLIKSMIDDHSDHPEIKYPFDMMAPNSLPFARGQNWTRIRRAVVPGLSVHKMKASAIEIESILNKLVEMIKNKISMCSSVACGATNCIEINLDVCITRYTLDYSFTNFFKQPNLITYTEKKDYWIYLLLTLGVPAFSRPHFGFLANLPILHPIINFLIRYTRFGTIIIAIKQFTIDAARLYAKARREAELENKHDPSFDFTKTNLIQLNDGSKFERKPVDYIIDRLYDRTLTLSEYVNSVCFLHFAAERTLCDVIIGVIHNLSLHPDVQKKLRLSLATEGAKSQYLNWIIKETVRLHPPVPFGCARHLRRDVYTKDGLLIPKGTHLHPSAYSIHRLKEYWGEDAEEFRPERWENERSFHPAQFLGFGLGKRNCPGKDLAFYEIAKVIERLIMTFRFKKSEKSQTLTSFTSPFLMFTATDNSPYVKMENLL